MRLTVGEATCVLVACLAGFGCAGSKEPGGAGEDCYRDEDCKSGLVCVANMNKVRVCSNDVTGLAGNVEGPPPPPAPEDAGVMDDAAAPVDDAAAPVDDAAAPVDDAGT
jgi:hypothetical protein